MDDFNTKNTDQMPSEPPAPPTPPHSKFPHRKTGVITEGHQNPPANIINDTDDIYDPFVEQLYADSLKDERKEVVATKVRTSVIIALIFALVGGPFLGLGLGIGTQIANNYFLPRLLDDSARRNDFAFDNVGMPIAVHDRVFVDYADLAEFVKPSIVTISAYTPRGGAFGFGGATSVSAGSGIIMYQTHSRVYIATNAHVIAEANRATVRINGGSSIPAHPVARDDEADLAIIAIFLADAINAGAEIRPAMFVSSENMRIGERVVAIGNAMGGGTSVTNGIISAKHRIITIGGRDLEVLQTNAAINQGNSGGALTNMAGEVIGINTAKFSERVAVGMGYAIRTDIAMPILEELMRIPPVPMVGVTFHMGLPPIVASVSGPAADAGILAGDSLLAIDGRSISGSDEAIRIIRSFAVGDTITLTIERGGEELEFEVTLVINNTLRF